MDVEWRAGRAILDAAADACELRVRVVPRAARDEVLGFAGDVLRVRVTAPPLDGRANVALLRVLAQALGVRGGALRIVVGKASREKRVAVDGLSLAEVRARLGEAPRL